jgi:hypothetical protein
MNNLGEVVGFDNLSVFPKNFADIWGASVSGLCSGGESGWPWPTASAINDAGQIVGTLANGVDNKTGAQESFDLSLTDQSNCNEP